MKQLLILFFLWYLRALAQLQLFKNRPAIIGITGSAGKTSTLYAVSATLLNHESIKISHKANSETGIPLNILGLKPSKFSLVEWITLVLKAPFKLLTNWERYQTYIVEMGIDSPYPPKNMSYLLKIVRPEIGIFLNARPMHSEPFDHLVTATNLEERKRQVTHLIATEKGKLITQLPATGTAILNVDDPEVALFRDQTKAQVLSIGHTAAVDLQVKAVSATTTGTTISLQFGTELAEVHLPAVALPDHFGITIAAGVAAGIARGMSFSSACEAIAANFSIPPGRASLIAGKNGSTILDSSYNASAQAVCDVLALLNTLPAKKRIAILGDIRELGTVAQLEHEQVAQVAAKVCDQVYLVGPQMKQFALPVLEQAKIKVRWFAKAQEAATHIAEQLTKDTVVLVKGSQNTLLLEIAVEELMADPSQAKKLLCRRGAFWDAQRAQLRL